MIRIGTMMTRPQARNGIRVVAAATFAAALLGSTAVAGADAPEITALSRKGLQRGTATTLVLSGRNLTPDTRLTLPAGAEQKPGAAKPAPNRLELVVTLPADAPLGVMAVRPSNAEGIGSLQLIEVTAAPEADEVEPNNEPSAATPVAALPAVLNGSIAGADVDCFRVSLKAGAKLRAEVLAQRLGGTLEPVLEIGDANGRLLAGGDRAPAGGVDVRLRFTAPADGEYVLMVHDLSYKGGPRGQYRLHLATDAGPDAVYPLGGRRGTELAVKWTGADLATPVAGTVDLRVGDHVDRVVARLPATGSPLAPSFVLAVSDLPELLEDETPAPADAKGPRLANREPARDAVVLNGRILAAREVDRWALDLPAGKWRAEIAAVSLGSALLPVLERHDAAGNTIATAPERADDPDPRLDFDVAAGKGAVVLAVRDLLKKGGPAFGYRLTVSRAGEPDYRVVLEDDLLNIPAGGTTVLRVALQRRGYDGPVTITVPDLPAGVILDGNVIRAGGNDALISLTAPAGTTVPAKRMMVAAEGRIGDRAVRRIARRVDDLAPAGGPLVSPWESSELWGGITAAKPVTIVATPRHPKLLPGVPLPLEVAVNRTDARLAANVKLQLLTDLTAPKVKSKKAAKTDAEPQFVNAPPAVVDAKADRGTLTLTVDLKTPLRPVHLAVEATATDAAGKAATTVYSRVIELMVAHPWTLRPGTDVSAAPGTKAALPAGVAREAGFDGDVIVTPTGLPAGFTAGPVTVAKGKDTADVSVTVPAGAKPGVVKFQLGSSWKVDKKNVYTAPAVPAAITVTAPVPKAETPKGAAPKPDVPKAPADAKK